MLLLIAKVCKSSSSKLYSKLVRSTSDVRILRFRNPFANVFGFRWTQRTSSISSQATENEKRAHKTIISRHVDFISVHTLWYVYIYVVIHYWECIYTNKIDMHLFASRSKWRITRRQQQHRPDTKNLHLNSTYPFKTKKSLAIL